MSSQTATVRHVISYTMVFVLGLVCANFWLGLNPPISPVDANIDAQSLGLHEAPKFSLSDHKLSLTVALAAALALIGAAVSAFKMPAASDGVAGQASRGRTKTLEVNRSVSREKDVEAVGKGLEKQIAQIMEVVRTYVDDTNAQSRVYDEVQSTLASANTAEQVQAVVKVLVASNLKAKRDAEELRGRLNKAQTETAVMREKLGRVEKLAALDALTSLANRRSFEDFLKNAVADSHIEHTPLSLVMADLDHFKRVNDKYGHQAGDAVIKTFSRILAENVRTTDLVARYGGEEFAVILPRTPMGNASSVVERIRKAIEGADWTDPVSGRRLERVTASFGIAEIMDDETPEKIVERADQKLYAAKRNGRNRVEIDAAPRA